MIWLLKWLWYGKACEHEWVDMEKSGLMNEDRVVSGYTILMRCKKCGEHKSYTFRNRS